MYFSADARPVTILRRPVLGNGDRGDFSEVFTLRGSIMAAFGPKIVEAGLVEGGAKLTVRFRDCANARSIGVADRARITRAGVATDYAIVSSTPARRGDGSVEIVIDDRIGG